MRYASAIEINEDKQTTIRIRQTDENNASFNWKNTFRRKRKKTNITLTILLIIFVSSSFTMFGALIGQAVANSNIAETQNSGIVYTSQAQKEASLPRYDMSLFITNMVLLALFTLTSIASYIICKNFANFLKNNLENATRADVAFEEDMARVTNKLFWTFFPAFPIIILTFSLLGFFFRSNINLAFSYDCTSCVIGCISLSIISMVVIGVLFDRMRVLPYSESTSF